MYKPITAKNFNSDWLRKVTFAEFKKNPIIATFPDDVIEGMYEKFTGKKKKSGGKK